MMDVLPIRPTESRLEVEGAAAKANFAGLDGVRAFAALGVVLLHAGVPYLKYSMPGLAWPVRDTASPLVDAIFWAIELSIMPLFLVLAGFLAWRTLDRRGAGALFKTRARRLLVPLLFGILIVLPLDLHAWVLGWVAEGIVAPVKLKSFKFDAGIDRDLWGLSHLWFLQYLFLYVALVALWSHSRRRSRLLNRITESLSAARTSTIVTALFSVAIVTLFFRPEVVWGFQHAFAPVGSKWIYSGTFFAGGLLIAARDPNLAWLQSTPRRLLGPAALLTFASVVLGRWHLSGQQSNLASTLLAAVTVLGATSVTLVTIALAVKHMRRTTTAISYLAAASFWIYLVHHPILGIVHLDLKWLYPEASSELKFVAAFVVSTSFSLLTYEGLVRTTRLGRWLGFDWSPPKRVVPEDVDSAARASDQMVESADGGASTRRAA